MTSPLRRANTSHAGAGSRISPTLRAVGKRPRQQASTDCTDCTDSETPTPRFTTDYGALERLHRKLGLRARDEKWCTQVHTLRVHPPPAPATQGNSGRHNRLSLKRLRAPAVSSAAVWVWCTPARCTPLPPRRNPASCATISLDKSPARALWRAPVGRRQSGRQPPSP